MANINRSGKSRSSERLYLLGLQRLYAIDYCPVFKSQHVVAKKEIVSPLPYLRTQEGCSPAGNSHTLPLLTPLLLPSQGRRMKADAQRRTRLCFSIWGGEPEQTLFFKTHTCTSLYGGKSGSFSRVGWEGKPTGRELFLSNDFPYLNFTFTLSHHSPPASLSNDNHSKATHSERQTFKSKRELSF